MPTNFYDRATISQFADPSKLPELFLLPDSSFRIEIHRFANGDGYLKAFRVGESIPYAIIGDVTGELKDKSPVQMNGTIFRTFAYDDLTPAPSGTYDAVLRTNCDPRLDASTSLHPSNLIGVDIQLNDILGTPLRTDVAIHVGNNTRNSEGCYVMGSADLEKLLEPIWDATGLMDSISATGAMRTDVGFFVGNGVDFKPTFLPTANALIDGTGVSTTTWHSAIQVQLIDDEPITQPTLSTGFLYQTSPGLFVAAITLSHAVSKDLELKLANTGAGLMHTNVVKIAAGTTTGYALFTAASGSTLNFNVIGVDVPDHPYKSPEKLMSLMTGQPPNVALPLSFDTSNAFNTNGAAIPSDTGYGGTAWLVTDPVNGSVPVGTTGFDVVTLAPQIAVSSASFLSAHATLLSSIPQLQTYTLPQDIEGLVLQGAPSMILAGNVLDNHVAGGTGNDWINGGLGADVLSGGGGANTFFGTLAELDTDVILDFSSADRIFFSGSFLTSADISLVAGSVDIVVDTNHDANPEGVITLDLDYDAFLASGVVARLQQESDGTFLSFIAPGSNHAPVAVTDSYSTNEDAALTIAAVGVLANDIDADGDALTSILVSGPSHGSLTLNTDGSFTYTPNANYNGADSFTYKANDGTADSTTAATVSLTVNAVNDPPVGANDTATTTAGHAVVIAAADLLTVSGSTTTRVGLIGLTSGRDQAARRALVWSAQAHGSSSSSFCIGQPLTSLARVSAR